MSDMTKKQCFVEWVKATKKDNAFFAAFFFLNLSLGVWHLIGSQFAWASVSLFVATAMVAVFTVSWVQTFRLGGSLTGIQLDYKSDRERLLAFIDLYQGRVPGEHKNPKINLILALYWWPLKYPVESILAKGIAKDLEQEKSSFNADDGDLEDYMGDYLKECLSMAEESIFRATSGQ